MSNNRLGLEVTFTAETTAIIDVKALCDAFPEEYREFDGTDFEFAVESAHIMGADIIHAEGVLVSLSEEDDIDTRRVDLPRKKATA